MTKDGKILDFLVGTSAGQYKANCVSVSVSVYTCFFSVNWGWALAIMLGVYVSQGVSGGHLNPAVTIALAVSGKLKQYRLIPGSFGH